MLRPLAGPLARLGLAQLGVALLVWAPSPASAQDAPTVAIQIAGEPTANGVVLHARLDGPGRARFQWVADDSGQVAMGRWLAAEPEADHVVKAALGDLRPGTLYRWRVQVEGRPKASPWSSFRTLYPVTRADDVSFAVVSCLNQHAFLRGRSFWFVETTPPAAQPDRRLGYRALETIAEDKPLFVIFNGDVVYYDKGPRHGEDAASMRAIWHEQFGLPRFAALFARTGTYWLKDDHDFRFDDADLTGERPPSPELGARIFREQVPAAAPDEPDAPAWRTHRVNADLQVWLLEGRDHRDPNEMEDTPAKSLWGEAQREWLKRTLLESRAAWRVVVSPTPLVGPDRRTKEDNHTNFDGFRSEGEAFLAWAAERGLPDQGLVVVTGDRHWQYHSIHPSGVHEIASGALHDENLARGTRPGSFWSTDPDGLIEQPFLEDDTGGYLRIDVERNDAGSNLRATWLDEFGTPRHRWEPPPRP